jgi:hypothetical protein
MSGDTDNAAIGSLAIAHSLAIACLIDLLITKKLIELEEIAGPLDELANRLTKADLGKTGPGTLTTLVQQLRTRRGEAGRA